MADETLVAISFKDMDAVEEVRERAEKRCRALAAEFPEPTHIELTLTPDGVGFSAHAHVTGRAELAAHAISTELALAADRALEKLGKALRKAHDKRLFARRREAMLENPKRRGR